MPSARTRRQTYPPRTGTACGRGCSPRSKANVPAICTTPGKKAFSQSICFDRNRNCHIWTVSLLSEEICCAFCGLLDNTKSVLLGEREITVDLIEKKEFDTPSAFWETTRLPENTATHELQVLTPTAFKSKGEYVVFPEVRQIVRRLVAKWNTVFPDNALDAETVCPALESGLKIRDYNLSTYRFEMKKNKIPGFCGRIILTSSLSSETDALWRTLLGFACFSGIGIKTALGMGGVKVSV